MKIVSAHQPHYLPWLSYFNKVERSDVFIWLEDVQFRKNYFQNRTKVKGNSGELWLSIPVKKASLGTKINAIEIANKKDIIKTAKTLRTYYSKAPFFKTYFPQFEAILMQDYTHLNDLNYNLFTEVLKLLAIDTEIIRSTALLDKDYEDANERLLAMCQSAEATHYIAGKGGRNYMDEALFNKNKIEILWQDFPISSVTYEQLNGDFVTGLSVIDTLFNIGAEETKLLIQTPWQTN